MLEATLDKATEDQWISLKPSVQLISPEVIEVVSDSLSTIAQSPNKRSLHQQSTRGKMDLIRALRNFPALPPRDEFYSRVVGNIVFAPKIAATTDLGLALSANLVAAVPLGPFDRAFRQYQKALRDQERYGALTKLCGKFVARADDYVAGALFLMPDRRPSGLSGLPLSFDNSAKVLAAYRRFMELAAASVYGCTFCIGTIAAIHNGML